MKHQIVRLSKAAAAIALALSPVISQATLSDLEALQLGNGNLVFQYGFEGVDDSTRLADGSANAFTLQRTAGSGGGDVNDIQFVGGFEGGSQAYQPSFDTSAYQVGAGLNTISTAVPVGADITAEVVLQVDTFVQPADNTTGAYILSARPQPGNGRAYFFRQMADPTPRVTSTLGNTFGDVPVVFSPNAGDWYYLAMAASYDSGADQTAVDWYFANLSLGETALTVLSDNTTFQGLFDGTSQIGVGNFLNGTQEFVQGRLDNVALTNELLDQTTLQGRLDAIYIPEPSTLALLGLGGLTLLGRRRTRN